MRRTSRRSSGLLQVGPPARYLSRHPTGSCRLRCLGADSFPMDVRGLVGRLTVVQRVVIGLVLVVFAVLVAKVSGLALVFLLALGGWIYYRYRQNAQVAAARAEEEAKRAQRPRRASQEKRRFVREKPPPEETSPAWPYEILGVASAPRQRKRCAPRTGRLCGVTTPITTGETRAPGNGSWLCRRHTRNSATSPSR